MWGKRVNCEGTPAIYVSLCMRVCATRPAGICTKGVAEVDVANPPSYMCGCWVCVYVCTLDAPCNVSGSSRSVDPPCLPPPRWIVESVFEVVQVSEGRGDRRKTDEPWTWAIWQEPRMFLILEGGEREGAVHTYSWICYATAAGTRWQGGTEQE